MRFLIIIGIVCGLGWYAWHTFKTGDGLAGSLVSEHVGGVLANPTAAFRHRSKEPVKSSDADSSAVGGAGTVVPVSTGAPVAVSAPVALPPGVTLAGVPAVAAGGSMAAGGAIAGPPVIPPITNFYAFKHREPPTETDLMALAKFGVQVAVDRASRVALIVGPKEAVETVSLYLEKLDLVGGSCAVQTWAVYVDKTAQKGFDLVAAIKATVGAVDTVTLGAGGFTLDVGAADIGVALSAICNGSTVEVVQRPHVRLAHGLLAKVDSSQEFPIPATTVSNGIAQTSVTYRKVGLELEVMPYFLGQDRVRLGVVQRNGIVGNNVTIEGSTVPIIETQSVETTAEMTVGQTIILGGATTQRVRISRGLLGSHREVSEGSMYVILSTYFDEPKAIVVSRPVLESPAQLGPVPLSIPDELPGDWIAGELLPPLHDSGSEERKFLRARAAK